jgi:ABC-type histidine transport system ATPase subunit
MTELLQIENLTVAYGQVLALKGVTLTVGAGEAVALVGANGAVQVHRRLPAAAKRPAVVSRTRHDQR